MAYFSNQHQSTFEYWPTALAASLLLVTRPASAQEAIRNSIAGAASAEARKIRAESLPYTIKSGDFRLFASPSLSLDWNDNIRTTREAQEDDFILRPFLDLNASYPLTQRNLLALDVGFGYDKYLEHDELSTWRVRAGSGLSFDVAIGDVLLNAHDRFSYARDSAQEPAIANTSRYGIIKNTAGLLFTWDLEDLTLSLGYDHQDTISPASEFESQDRSTEMVVARAGFRLNPRLTAGLEASGNSTAYAKTILNDNQGYSFGIYGDWQPGESLHVQPRCGYTFYQFRQTSQSIRTGDLNSWYVDLTATHQVTEVVSYSISAGHEIRLGIQSDAIEDWYVRPSVQWAIIRNLSLSTYLSYEHGKQGEGNITGNLKETYDWFGGGVNVSYPIVSRLRLGLTYRLTVRASDVVNREYTQNLVGVELSYIPQ